jgi:hypothetical protein
VYACQATTDTVVAGVISIAQNPLPTIDNVFYRLKNAGMTVIQNVTATGLNPIASFTAVASGNYHVEFRYGTLVNGVTIYSDDVSQLNAWCTATVDPIVVP